VSVLEELEFVKNWIADGERNIALNRKGIGDAITVTNKIDAKSLLFTQEFLKKYECFLNSQETKIKTSMGEIGGELIQGTLKSIEKYLENIDTKVAELQEGR
jgi:molecular chaperone DnaK (HSP70)